MFVRCLQAFRVAGDCADGVVEVEVSGEDGVGAAAARACAAINDKAHSEGLCTTERGRERETERWRNERTERKRADRGDFFSFKKRDG